MEQKLNILIISEIINFKHAFIRHYSLNKGYDLALALTKLCNVNYANLHEEFTQNNINFINFKNITDEFIDTLNYVIFIRETNMFELLQYLPIKKLLLTENRKCKTIIKSDSLSWIYNITYNTCAKRINNCSMLELTKKFYDIICVQNIEYLLNNKRRFQKSGILDRIIISPMGVPNLVPTIDTTFYDVNHSYCVKETKQIKDIKKLVALYPKPVLTYTKEQMQEFNRPKKRLLYFGRLKTDDGKILNFMSDILKILGDDYELHLYPGSMSFDGQNYSSKNVSTLEKLRTEIFATNSNIIVHTPFEHNNLNIISNCDVAIDFSPTRPNNVKNLFHNVKLLEYCYMGLKVVSEENVANSFLVNECLNGIVLKGIPSAEEYAEAIKKVNLMECDKTLITNKIIELYNWDKIALNLITDIENKFK